MFVKIIKAVLARRRSHEVAAGVSNHAFKVAFVIAPRGSAKPVIKQVRRLGWGAIALSQTQIINQIRAKEELGNVINCRSSQSTTPTMNHTNLFNFAHTYKLSFLQSKLGKHLMLLSLENFMQRRTILSPSVGNV